MTVGDSRCYRNRHLHFHRRPTMLPLSQSAFRSGHIRIATTARPTEDVVIVIPNEMPIGPIAFERGVMGWLRSRSSPATAEAHRLPSPPDAAYGPARSCWLFGHAPCRRVVPAPFCRARYPDLCLSWLALLRQTTRKGGWRCI